MTVSDSHERPLSRERLCTTELGLGASSALSGRRSKAISKSPFGAQARAGIRWNRPPPLAAMSTVGPMVISAGPATIRSGGSVGMAVGHTCSVRVGNTLRAILTKTPVFIDGLAGSWLADATDRHRWMSGSIAMARKSRDRPALARRSSWMASRMKTAPASTATPP